MPTPATTRIKCLDWCNNLARKIASRRVAVTGSRLDLLSPGEELVRVPAGVIAMTWASDVYHDPPPVLYHRNDGTVAEKNLLDFDLKIVESREGSVIFAILNDEIEWRGQFSLEGINLFQAALEDGPDMVVHRGNEDVWIEDYLNEELPSFYTSDLSAIEGPSIFRVPQELEVFRDDSFETIDWANAGIDITKEKPSGNGLRSIFE